MERPIIGGNRPNWDNQGNIHIGDTNIGNQWHNRPNWDVDPGYSRPGWGIHDDWHNHWHDHCINDHYHWYNGCWHGYWGSSWYAPVAWGAVGWGLGAWTSGWGYGGGYYNPYYPQSVTVQAAAPYDYSQPVVVNNYVSSESQGGAAAGGVAQAEQPDSANEAAMAAFDEGLAKFKSGDYLSALTQFNSALKQMPGDPVVHEVRALALFAVGKYTDAAAGLNSLLSSAPGMDWTTMSGLYGNVDDYTEQLRRLEQYCEANPNDAPSHFVLAYHYLVTDAKENAIDALQVVVKNQPKDVTAKRMLDALEPAAEQQAAPAPATAANQADAPQTDLVGTWTAKAGDTLVELAITDDSKFTWLAKTQGQADVKLAGNISAAADGIALETTDQGTMAGTVTSKGPDAWSFAISGAPASDPGLSFTRKN